MDQNSAREISALTPAETTPAKDIKLSEHQKPKTPESGLSELILRLEKSGETGIKQDIAKQSLQDAVSTIKREEGETDEEHTMNLFIARQGIIETSKLLKTTDFGLEDAKQILTQEYSTATGMDIDQIEETSRFRDLDLELSQRAEKIGATDMIRLIRDQFRFTGDQDERVEDIQKYTQLKQEIAQRQKQIIAEQSGFYGSFASRIKDFMQKQGQKLDEWTISHGIMDFIGRYHLSEKALQAAAVGVIAFGAVGAIFKPDSAGANEELVDDVKPIEPSDEFFDDENEAVANISIETHNNILSDIARFGKEISEFKSLGFNFVPKADIAGVNRENDQLQIWRLVQDQSFDDPQRENVLKADSQLPLHELLAKYEINKHVESPLRENSGDIEISPISISSIRINQSEGIVRIYDWLDQENPLKYERKIEITDLNDEIPRIYAYINELYDAQKMQNIIDEMPSAENEPQEDYTYTTLKDRSMTPQQKQNANNLLNHISNNQLFITAAKEGDSVDHVETIGDTEIKKDLKITGDILDAIGDKPLAVNGLIGKISLSSDIPVEYYDQEKGIINNFPIEGEFLDGYGNLVKVKASLIDEGKVSYASITITPKIDFSREENKDRKEDQFAPVNLDLERFGLGKIEGLIYQRVEEPVAFVGANNEYAVFSNLDHEYVNTEYEYNVSAIANGIRDAETLFGFEPGSHIKNINILNADTANAFFGDENPETILIYDELLKEKGLDFSLIAKHESIHKFDRQYSISTALGEYFESINNSDKWFLYGINEKAIMDNPAFLGHAQDDVFEYFASFVNSISSMPQEKWQERIIELNQGSGNIVESKYDGDKFLKLYNESLTVLRKSLIENGNIPNDAPIYASIDQKIEFLNKYISEKPNEK